MHIDLREGWVEINAFSENKLVSSRSSPIDNEDNIERVIRECKQSVNLSTVQAIVLSGKANGWKREFVERLEKEFNVPVQLLNEDLFSFTHSPSKSSWNGTWNQNAWPAVAGATLIGEDQWLDLLPKEKKATRAG